MRKNFLKIYISNFLLGLIFWYGIEKLFMQQIGIDAGGIGIIVAGIIAFKLFFDIPSGIMADRWSRKGTLIVATLAMMICVLILGNATSFWMYLVGYVIFYGIYSVCISGSYHAIVYDTLHELDRTKEYSKIMGRAFSFFLCGIGIANIASGFIAHALNFQATYFVTLIPCFINLFLILSVYEPTFHKKEQKSKAIRQLGSSIKVILKISTVRVLVILLSAFTVVRVFRDNFGQLYAQHYINSPEVIGIIWAFGAFTWATGYFIAHKFRGHVGILVVTSTVPLIAMSFIDSWISLVIFGLQSIAMAALFNHVETAVQDSTPSSVRSSVLSVISSLGMAVAVPVSIIIGYAMRGTSVIWGLRIVTIIAALVFLYWLWQRYIRHSMENT